MSKRVIEFRCATADAIAYLSQLLALPTASQDWEIQSADPNRIDEFLRVYEQHPLDDDQRFGLMEVIVASCDDLSAAGRSNEAEWDRIRRHLFDRFDLHAYTVQYWSLPDEDDGENVFNVTPRARGIMATRSIRTSI